jgi:DMSO/TMAO reductase YedYZ heme-binding membrane subunit
MLLGIGATNRFRSGRWPGFAQQELHRRMSMLAVVFVAIHVLTSVLDTYVNIGWAAIVLPFTSPYSRFWVGVGTVGLDLMVAVFITSLLRQRMRASTWRAVHWLAYLCWPVALAHTFGMGTDARELWVVVLGAACVASVLGALIWRVRVSARQRNAVPVTSATDSPRKYLVLQGDPGVPRHGA